MSGVVPASSTLLTAFPVTTFHAHAALRSRNDAEWRTFQRPRPPLLLMHRAKFVLLALATLGLSVWLVYAVVVGVLGGSEGRAGAAVGAATTLALAAWSGTSLVRFTRAHTRSD
jgi:hypothetical protein